VRVYDLNGTEDYQKASAGGLCHASAQTQQVFASGKRKWRQASPGFAVHPPNIIIIITAIGATMNLV
jgi:hypothetical protein